MGENQDEKLKPGKKLVGTNQGPKSGSILRGPKSRARIMGDHQGQNSGPRNRRPESEREFQEVGIQVSKKGQEQVLRQLTKCFR